MTDAPALHYPDQPTTLPDGNVMVTSRDVPEAITQGRDEANALYWSSDALAVAL